MGSGRLSTWELGPIYRKIILPTLARAQFSTYFHVFSILRIYRKNTIVHIVFIVWLHSARREVYMDRRFMDFHEFSSDFRELP